MSPYGLDWFWRGFLRSRLFWVYPQVIGLGLVGFIAYGTSISRTFLEEQAPSPANVSCKGFGRRSEVAFGIPTWRVGGLSKWLF